MPSRGGHSAAWLAVGALVLAACSSPPPAPVVDRSVAPVREQVPVDGLYRVRRGDSLHVIAFRYGLDWRDIAAWNGIRSPYTIFPDQVLRLKPSPRTASRPAATNQTMGKVGATSQPSGKTGATAARPAAPPPAPNGQGAAAQPSGSWVWPVQGRLLRTFKPGDPARNGLDIAGREGQAIRAAAPGDVVYSGNGLIGYGELVIVKHSEQVLSAYGHNRKRLVSEGDRVEQGQQIAELGRNGRNEQILHFEIRVSGKPVDPLNYLPKQ